MQAPGSEGRRNYETTGVYSPDGEYLPFVSPIVTEGRPEEWLNRVEEAMFAATKKHLFRVRCISIHNPIFSTIVHPSGFGLCAQHLHTC